MLASLFQFSFLCFVSLANLCLGFAIASRLGLGPSLAAFFRMDSGPCLDFEPATNVPGADIDVTPKLDVEAEPELATANAS